MHENLRKKMYQGISVGKRQKTVSKNKKFNVRKSKESNVSRYKLISSKMYQGIRTEMGQGSAPKNVSRNKKKKMYQQIIHKCINECIKKMYQCCRPKPPIKIPCSANKKNVSMLEAKAPN